MTAVQQNSNALQYVKEQTLDICLAAVQKNGNALYFVKEQHNKLIYKEICLAAVQQKGDALQYVKEQTYDIFLAALQQNRKSYLYINKSMRNELNTITITETCITLYPLRLPSYVLMQIVDYILEENTLTHLKKIEQVIRINEYKRTNN